MRKEKESPGETARRIARGVSAAIEEIGDAIRRDPVSGILAAAIVATLLPIQCVGR